MSEAKYLSTRQAAEYLGRHPDTLARWRSEKCGPKYFLKNGRYYYTEFDLNYWMEGIVK